MIASIPLPKPSDANDVPVYLKSVVYSLNYVLKNVIAGY